MKRFTRIALFILLSFASTGCTSIMSSLWDSASSILSYFNMSGKGLLSKGKESSKTMTKQEFFGERSDYIPLSEQDVHTQTIEFTSPQPSEVPGEPGGRIPGIEAFFSPGKDLSHIFTKIYFETDQHVPKGQDSAQIIAKMASYLKKHPNTYVFVTGHCDERASESYNLSLGTKRSNYVRNSLIKHGVNPEQLYTISYGREQPEALGHNEKAWAKNRRVAFKIYQKRTAI